MEAVPVRHKRATATLDEEARARLWGTAGCSGDGSWNDRSAGCGLPELADLVDSFYDEDDAEGGEGPTAGWRRRETEWGGCRRGGDGLGLSEREFLEGLVDVGRRDRAGSRIKAEVELAVRSIANDVGKEGEGRGDRVSKRRLMWRLRDKGFDAGLCKSRLWAVSHEYVDVVADGGARYVVELNLAAEFEIARPTPRYQALLDAMPVVFVGRPDAVKDIVRVMCAAAAASMKSREMHVPPWRKREYVQGKWLGPYKRTTSREPERGAAAAVSATAVAGVGAATGMMGYQQSVYCCRADCARSEGLKGRKQAVGFNGMYL